MAAQKENKAGNANSAIECVKGLRIPKLEKTGVSSEDSELDAKHKLLQDMVGDLWKTPRYILPVYQKWQEMRAQADRKISGTDAGDPEFEAVSTIGKVDESFLMKFFTKVSDMKHEVLVEAVKKESDCLQHLLEFSVQLAPSLKMLSSLRVKDVMRRMLEARALHCGSRLQDAVKNGLLNETGDFGWSSAGCYSLTFKDNKVTHVKHCNGDRVACHGFDTSFNLTHNWSDWKACVQKAPLPPVKLHVFFQAAKTGPYKIGIAWTPKTPAYAQEVDKHYKSWQEDKQKTAGGPASVLGTEAAAAMAAHRASQKRTLLDNARKKALENIAAKKRRQSISLAPAAKVADERLGAQALSCTWGASAQRTKEAMVAFAWFLQYKTGKNDTARQCISPYPFHAKMKPDRKEAEPGNRSTAIEALFLVKSQTLSGRDGFGAWGVVCLALQLVLLLPNQLMFLSAWCFHACMVVAARNSSTFPIRCAPDSELVRTGGIRLFTGGRALQLPSSR
eukprot:1019527-Amphidinium_carterae.2